MSPDVTTDNHHALSHKRKRTEARLNTRLLYFQKDLLPQRIKLFSLCEKVDKHYWKWNYMFSAPSYPILCKPLQSSVPPLSQLYTISKVAGKLIDSKYYF